MRRRHGPLGKSKSPNPQAVAGCREAEAQRPLRTATDLSIGPRASGPAGDPAKLSSVYPGPSARLGSEAARPPDLSVATSRPPHDRNRSGSSSPRLLSALVTHKAASARPTPPAREPAKNMPRQMKDAHASHAQEPIVSTTAVKDTNPCRAVRSVTDTNRLQGL